jgi:hypothetical protein
MEKNAPEKTAKKTASEISDDIIKHLKSMKPSSGPNSFAAACPYGPLHAFGAALS